MTYYNWSEIAKGHKIITYQEQRGVNVSAVSAVWNSFESQLFSLYDLYFAQFIIPNNNTNKIMFV